MSNFVRFYLYSLHIPTKTVHQTEAVFVDAKCAMKHIAMWSGGDWIYALMDVEAVGDLPDAMIAPSGQVLTKVKGDRWSDIGREVDPWKSRVTA
jgi:hypothetical protein